MENRPLPLWLNALDAEDFKFLKLFLLNSGSLKALAGIYDISYPTIRLRLDRLIDKVDQADKEGKDTFVEALKDLTFAGKLTAEEAQDLLEIHKATRQT
ncbi:MAG: DUF2089 family protein [Eubacteriales bacterium]|nr:DUF2089 family protein [Eubacteriales bacterium]